MFEKIGWYAEKAAVNAGQSRRSFLGRLGQASMGLAGLVGALLLFPGEAQAFTGCQYSCPDGTVVRKNCPCGGLSIKHKGMTCFLAAKDCPYG
jgi:hypothetical protein